MSNESRVAGVGNGPRELTIIRSQLLDATSLVRFGISTRLGGVSPAPLGMNLSFRVGDADENVITNRNMFFGELGISLQQIASPMQVHGGMVRNAYHPGEYADCDALVTGVLEVSTFVYLLRTVFRSFCLIRRRGLWPWSMQDGVEPRRELCETRCRRS